MEEGPGDERKNGAGDRPQAIIKRRDEGEEKKAW